ncbi:unnamed protein product [Urochloa humidicola]
MVSFLHFSSPPPAISPRNCVLAVVCLLLYLLCAAARTCCRRLKVLHTVRRVLAAALGLHNPAKLFLSIAG